MGSFNVAATMSNLSISPGDKVVFFALTPTCAEQKGAKVDATMGQSYFVSNFGASLFFYPRFLPIVGEYNDYGSIDRIEYDDNVQYIEEYFGISIDDFMRQIGVNKWGSQEITCIDAEKTDELYHLSGMFELLPVYQDMVAFNKQKDNALDMLPLNLDTLEMMGFKFKNKSDDMRFNLVFVHPEIKDYIALCDKNSSVFRHCGSRAIENLRSPRQVMDFFSNVQFGGLEAIKDRCIHSLKVEKAIQSMAEIQRLEAQYGIEAWMHIRKKPQDDCYSLQIWEKMMYVIEQAASYKFGLEDAFVDLLNFNAAMYKTNNFYYPAAAGPQFGDYAANEALCESALRCAKEGIALGKDKVDDDDCLI